MGGIWLELMGEDLVFLMRYLGRRERYKIHFSKRMEILKTNITRGKARCSHVNLLSFAFLFTYVFVYFDLEKTAGIQ